jgi:hypothetical protein
MALFVHFGAFHEEHIGVSPEDMRGVCDQSHWHVQ